MSQILAGVAKAGSIMARVAGTVRGGLVTKVSTSMTSGLFRGIGSLTNQAGRQKTRVSGSKSTKEFARESSRPVDRNKDLRVKTASDNFKKPSDFLSAIQSAFGLLWTAIVMVLTTVYLIIPFIDKFIGAAENLRTYLHDYNDRKMTQIRSHSPSMSRRHLIYLVITHFFVSIFITIYLFICDLIYGIWKWKWYILITFTLFLITFGIATFFADIMYLSSGMAYAGVTAYNEVFVKLGNLGLAINQLMNPFTNFTGYQYVKFVMLFVEYAARIGGVELTEDSNPQGRSLDESQTVDADALIPFILPGLSHMAYFSHLNFLMEFSTLEILLKIFPDLGPILTFITRIVLKVLCLFPSPGCFYLQLLQNSVGTLINLITSALGFGNVVDIGCRIFSPIVPCECSGDMFNFDDDGVYPNLRSCGNRRLIECSFEETLGIIVESIDGVVVHTDHREEHACPNSRRVLDPIGSARFMHHHDTPNTYEVCIGNQRLLVDHRTNHEVVNLGRCNPKQPTVHNFNVTQIPPPNAKSLRKKKGKMKQQQQQQGNRLLFESEEVGDYTREDAVKAAREKVGTERFVMFEYFECDLSEGKPWQSPFHTAYDSVCIAYVLFNDYKRTNPDVLNPDHIIQGMKTTQGSFHRGLKETTTSSEWMDMNGDVLGEKKEEKVQGAYTDVLRSSIREIRHTARIFRELVADDPKSAFSKTADIIDFKYQQQTTSTSSLPYVTLPHILHATLHQHKEISKRGRKLSEGVTSEICEPRCAAGEFCCPSRTQCVEDLSDCTDPVPTDGFVTYAGYYIAQAQIAIENFDVVSLIDARKCYKEEWGEHPTRNPLSPYNLWGGGDCRECVWCFPTRPMITERFEPIEMDEAADVLSDICPGNDSPCVCPRYKDEAGVREEIFEFGFTSSLVWQRIKKGFVTLGDIIYLINPWVHKIPKLIWQGVHIILQSPADVVSQFSPELEEHSHVVICVILNLYSLFYFILFGQILILVSMASVNIIVWVWGWFFLRMEPKELNMLYRLKG